MQRLYYTEWGRNGNCCPRHKPVYIGVAMREKYTPRWATFTAAVALAVLATVGLRWCVAMASHAPEHCHDCGSSMGMDVGEHLAWWQGQLRSTPAADIDLSILAFLVLAIAVASLTAAATPLPVDVRFQRQRFRPPGASYLAEMLSDGILNPKLYSAAR